MTTYFFLTCLYTLSVVVVGFFCTLGVQETRINMALKISEPGKPATQEQAKFWAWVGILITIFLPVLNTGVFIIVIVKIVKAVKKHYE